MPVEREDYAFLVRHLNGEILALQSRPRVIPEADSFESNVAVELAPGRQHGTRLMRVDGLTLGLVVDVGHTHRAARDVLFDMHEREVPSGIILFDRLLAPQLLGPVPADLLASGVSYALSDEEHIEVGATRLIREYFEDRAELRASLGGGSSPVR